MQCLILKRRLSVNFLKNLSVRARIDTVGAGGLRDASWVKEREWSRVKRSAKRSRARAKKISRCSNCDWWKSIEKPSITLYSKLNVDNGRVNNESKCSCEHNVLNENKPNQLMYLSNTRTCRSMLAENAVFSGKQVRLTLKLIYWSVLVIVK